MINKRRYLIKESLRRKIFSRWFLGINIVIFLFMLISFNIDTLITLFGGDFKDEKTILVIDNTDMYKDFKKEFIRISEFQVTKYKVNRFSDLDELKNKVVHDSNVIGLELMMDEDNYVKANVYSLQGISNITKNIISSSLNNIKRERMLNSYGINQDELDKIEESVSLESVILSETKVNENKDVSSAVLVLVFVIPCFFLITTLIQMVGSEINEEKSTKSMEIIISNVPAKEHLLSKIISCTIFTFIQIFLLLSFILIASLTHSRGIGTLSQTSTKGYASTILGNLITDSFIDMAITIAPILLISFIITLITYALLAGVFASMTTNVDDFQQLQTPIMLTISISFYIALLAALFEGSIFIKIMSYVPLVSFMVSPTLYMLNQVPLISVIISTVIQLIFLLIVYHYGIKIYRVGILNYSGEHLWRKIIKALK